MLRVFEDTDALTAAAACDIAATLTTAVRAQGRGSIALSGGDTPRTLYQLLAKKFFFDEVYQAVFARGSVGLGTALWRVGDVALIDGAAVNGSARAVGWLSGVMRRLQSGYLYHYAFAMIIGLSVLLAWYVLR